MRFDVVIRASFLGRGDPVEFGKLGVVFFVAIVDINLARINFVFVIFTSKCAGAQRPFL